MPNISLSEFFHVFCPNTEQISTRKGIGPLHDNLLLLLTHAMKWHDYMYLS